MNKNDSYNNWYDATHAALMRTMESPNERDSNGEPANVVDGLFAIARALHDVAFSIQEMDTKTGKE